MNQAICPACQAMAAKVRVLEERVKSQADANRRLTAALTAWFRFWKCRYYGVNHFIHERALREAKRLTYQCPGWN